MLTASFADSPIKPGSYVKWDNPGDKGHGRVMSVHRDGAVPNVTKGEAHGTHDDPAARVHVHEKHKDGWRGTERYAAHHFSGLYIVGRLPAPSSDPDNDGDNDTPGAGGDPDNDAPATMGASASDGASDVTIAVPAALVAVGRFAFFDDTAT